MNFNTEDPDAGKLDDLVWRSETDKPGIYEHNFLQAKHLLDGGVKITFRDLSKLKQKEDSLKSNEKDKRTFSLEKFFLSYRDQIKKNFNGKINKLIIATNIDFDDELRSSFEPLQENIPILNFMEEGGSKKPENLRFKKGDYYRKELAKQFKSAYGSVNLIEELLKDISRNGDVTKESSLSPYFYELLENKVINKSGKFDSSFINNNGLSKKARIFREFLLELGFKDKKENPSNNFNILKPEEFVEEIASLIKKDGEAIIKVERRKEIIRNNIDRLAHYVLVADEQNKVTFSRVFWKEDDKKLPGNLNVFRSKLKDNFINSKLIDENDNGSQIYEKLRKYHFKITGENNDIGKKFTTCRESLASEEAFWEAMEDGSIENNINKILPCENFPETSLSEIKNEIEEFFERLTFVVGYSQEILDEFIKKKCSWFIGFNTDYAAYGLQSRIADIFNLKAKEFISTDEDVAKFFDHARHQLDQLTVAGLTFEYSAQIEDLGVAFSRELSGLIQFLSFGERQIFNLVNPHNTMLSSIKVFQTLNSIPNYQKYDSHIFVCSGFSLSVQDRIINAFRLESNNLIVIECKPEKKDVDQLYCQLSEVIDYYSNKKVILITQGKHPLAAKFEKDYADRYIVEKDERNSLADLTPESQEKLLERENIIFQGETLNLSGLVDILDGELLCKLVNNEKIEIGQAFIDSRYRDVEHCYIDRRFCRDIEIRGNFRKKNPEFFLIDDQKSIEGDPQPGQDIISISDDNKSFSKLRNEYRTYNIHWLKKEKNNFMWQESHGSLLKLRKLVVHTKEQSGKEYKQEEIEVTPDKPVIIAGKAGMGKSIVLNYLALRIKESDPSLWVVRINLLDCVTELETAKASKIEFDEVEAIKFLYRNLYFQLFQSTEEEKQMMENVLSSLTVKEGKISLEDYEGKIKNLNLLEIRLFSHLYNQGKVVLLFDGFDEISPSYGKKVIELLKVLKETKVKKLWITTRPYNIVNKTLEDQLSVFSYQLKPFLQDEQKDFLKKLWKAKYKLSDLDEKRSGVFIDELLNIFSKSIDCQDFLCVPLQISMVAEVFQGIFKEFYDHGDHEVCDIQKQKLSEKMDLSVLYRIFVLKKFYEIYFREKISTAGAANPYIKALIDQQYKTFILDHERLAAYMIFKEDKVEDLLSPQEIKKVHKLIRKVKRGEEKTGIIESVVGNVPKFVHRTFAEYFVSELVYRRLQQSLKNLNQSQVSQDKIWEFFLDHILMQDKYDVIRRFINYQLADDKLFRLMEDRQKQLKLGKIKVLLQKVKNGERTQLHFALEGASLSTFIVLLDNGAYLSIGDNELSRPLHLAAENGYLEFVKALVPYLSSDSVGMNVRNIDGKSALHLAAMNNYQDIVEFLLDYVVSVGKLKEYINAESLFEETPLHLTAIYGCKASASTLLKFANDNNILLEVINAAGADRYTPLYLAIKNNQFDVVELLLNIAKDNLILTEAINVKDRDKASLLHLAAENGHEDIVKLLLYFAEDTEDFMNAENLSCHTALSLAIENGKENVVRILLNIVKDKRILTELLNAKDINNSTPLHLAASSEKYEIVKTLLNAAKQEGILLEVINSQDKDKMTPLDLAALFNEDSVVNMLLKAIKEETILTEFINSQDEDRHVSLQVAEIEVTSLYTSKVHRK